MSDPGRRWRTPPGVRDWINNELRAARHADDAWPHLERAHIVSQPWAWPHTRVHAAMLGVAARDRDRHEAAGQIVRLLVAGLGSLTGRYPPGNTGRATMRLTEHAPIPAVLTDLLPDSPGHRLPRPESSRVRWWLRCGRRWRGSRRR